MKNISLRDLLEAGCHFGHSLQRWHPKAASFIYEGRDGVHIIDLAKTKAGLENAGEFVKNLAVEGKKLLLVATKRQAKGVVTEVANKGDVNYLTNRWIGGFITNWEEVKKNIDKLNGLRKEKDDGSWSKFPKHEVVKLLKTLQQLEIVYGGVANLTTLPDCMFIVDIKKEVNCLREALRRSIPTIAIVDTNTDPSDVDYPIAANDDAVGSIQYITNYIVDAYLEGRKLREKQEGRESKRVERVAQVEQVVKVDIEEKVAQAGQVVQVEIEEKVVKVGQVEKVAEKKEKKEVKNKDSKLQRSKVVKKGEEKVEKVANKDSKLQRSKDTKEKKDKPKKRGRPKKSEKLKVKS